MGKPNSVYLWSNHSPCWYSVWCSTNEQSFHNSCMARFSTTSLTDEDSYFTWIQSTIHTWQSHSFDYITSVHLCALIVMHFLMLLYVAANAFTLAAMECLKNILLIIPYLIYIIIYMYICTLRPSAHMFICAYSSITSYWIICHSDSSIRKTCSGCILG